MGVTLAAIAFPPGVPAGVDLAAAPRRALEVTLQLAGVLVVGGPILAVTQPFLHGIETIATLALLVLLLAALGRRLLAQRHQPARATCAPARR